MRSESCLEGHLRAQAAMIDGIPRARDMIVLQLAATWIPVGLSEEKSNFQQLE